MLEISKGGSLIMFKTSDERWKSHRKFIHQQFVRPDVLKKTSSILKSEVLDAIQLMAAKNGQAFDVFPLLKVSELLDETDPRKPSSIRLCFHPFTF